MAFAMVWFWTETWPLIWMMGPRRASTWAVIVRVWPGVAVPRIFAFLMEVRRICLSCGMLGSDCAATPPSCAMASSMMTPGQMGWPGKWPSRKGSLPVMV